MTLTKRDIARRMHEAEPSISITEAIEIVDAIFASIKGRLAQAEKVMITNFGTFDVVEREARRGVNPATGERMIIESHRAVSFSAAPALQDSVNE